MADINTALKNDIAHVGDLIKTAGGDLGQIEGLPNLKNALFHRLMTVPGTLVHRPTYGVGMPLYQNAPNSLTLQQEVAALIQEQFIQDPRVQAVSSVSITSEDGTPQLMKLSVSVIVVGYTDAQQMTFTPFAEGV